MNATTRKISFFTLNLAVLSIPAQARTVSKEREKYMIADKDLYSDTEYKRKIVKKLKVDQLLDILEDLAISRLRVLELEERIKVYEQLEAKINADKEEEIKQIKSDCEEKLKKLGEPGSGEIASDDFITKIKIEGLDSSKIKYRVQIGQVSTYKEAEKLKNKVRSLDVDTWIIPLYHGYVIPLEIILDKIKENKC